jgi:diguanylate cyclase (GGDEF)-like protein
MKPGNDSTQLTSLIPALTQLFEVSGAYISLFDEEDMMVYANPAYYELTHQQPGTYPHWDDVIRNNYRLNQGMLVETANVEEWLAKAHQRRGSVLYRQFEVDTVDSRWILMSETVIPGVGLLAIGVDITGAKHSTTVLQQDYQQALVEAETDALTGMGNRRALDRLSQLLTLNGQNRLLSALMIDIDWFKPYNDSLGHQQGDVCLQSIADIIRSSLRSEEAYPLRIGGEEFLILMVGANQDTAEQIAQRILRNIRSRAIDHPTSDTGYVTLSIGVATTTVTDNDSLSAVLNDADKALYQSKHNGRDQVTLSADPV